MWYIYHIIRNKALNLSTVFCFDQSPWQKRVDFATLANCEYHYFAKQVYIKYVVCSCSGVFVMHPRNLKIDLFLRALLKPMPKLYIPSALNIDLILWPTQLIVCAENVKTWFKSWVFPFTFKAYTMPHTLNCMCVSLFKFHI